MLIEEAPMTTNFRIQKDVLGLFPELRVFSVLVRGATPSPAFIELGTRRLEEAVTHLRQLLPTSEALMGTPLITQWRDAYRSMCVKPSAYRCSFEALGRRAIAGKSLDTGVPAVNLYNAASIRHMACLGAYDVMRLADTPLELRFCRPEEDRFSPLGGSSSEMPLRSGLVVYAQDSEVLCWGLNHRDSERTCLRAETTDMVFMAEGVTPGHAEHAQKALAAIRADLQQLGFETSVVQELA
jgi:DNA/RNA-binding domain of Phe-tRNA-synthetase-like protein